GDRSLAAYLDPLLAPLRGTCIQVSAMLCLGSADHYLGLLAGTLGRWDEACRHFEAAVEMNTRIGAVPFAVTSRFHRALALRARGVPDDLALADAELERALETARALGMRLESAPEPPGAGV